MLNSKVDVVLSLKLFRAERRDGIGKTSKHWSLESGYDVAEDTNDTYPRRTSSTGIHAGLYVLVESQEHEVDPQCRNPVKGFKMMLHNPAVYPQVSQHYFRFPSKRAVVVGVHPKIMKTSEQLRSYSPHSRQCFSEYERQLHFFRIYTQENCESECYVNYTIDKCGCAQYYMPRDATTPICGPGSENCVNKIIHKYYFDMEYQRTCDCLPACTEIRYDVETSQAEYMWEHYQHSKDKKDGSISINFRDKQIITTERRELYGSYDFLANCGGLLGLFLGFSIISLVEIIYFLTLRLYIRLTRTDSPQHSE